MVYVTKTEVRLEERIERTLEETPGQSIVELATTLDVNRTFLAGYLRALEDHGEVTSRRIGPARVYFNGRNRSMSGDEGLV